MKDDLLQESSKTTRSLEKEAAAEADGKILGLHKDARTT